METAREKLISFVGDAADVLVPAVGTGQALGNRIPGRRLGPAARFLLDEHRARSRETYAKALWRAAVLLGWAEPLPRRSRPKKGEPANTPFVDVVVPILESCPWETIGADEVMVLEKQMAKPGMSQYTRNLTRTALRGVLEECEEMELITPRIHRQLRKKLRSGKTRRGEARIPPEEAQLKIEEVCRQAGDIGVRDLVVFELLTVIRRAEVAALDLRDVRLKTQTIMARDPKGGEPQKKALDPASIPLFEEWEAIRGRKKGAYVGRFEFIPTVGKAPLYTGERISPQTGYDICRRRCKQAKLPEVIRPHDWRRRYGTELLRNGAPLARTQKLMGHKSPTTTMLYDHSDFDEAQKWAGHASLAWNKKAKS